MIIIMVLLRRLFSSAGRARDLLNRFRTMSLLMEKKQKGNLVELQCITAFYELGYQVSIPYGENSRYDFVADIDNRLIRVQVKASHEVDENSFRFSCQSVKSKRSGISRRKYTKDEIDFFSTFYNGKCYLVPVEECSIYKTLRTSESKNNQMQNINFADSYELEKQIDKIKNPEH